MKRLMLVITGMLTFLLISCNTSDKGVKCKYTDALYEVVDVYDDLIGNNYRLITSSEDLDTFVGKINSSEDFIEKTQYDNTILDNVDFSKNDVVVLYEKGINTSNFDTCISSVRYKNGSLIVKGTNYKGYPLGTSYLSLIFIVVPDKKLKTVEDNLITAVPGAGTSVAYKPIIYLYNEGEMDLFIRFGNPSRLLTTYPKYNNGWDVTLTNGVINDGTNDYYALFYDEIRGYEASFDEGYYVEKDDAISFLEEKLTLIGFNYKERNECIMYWLPILESNEKSLVYFEMTEERNKECPLIMSKTPDSMLRVIIHIKRVEEKTNIKEENIVPFERSGFTLVEWGGTTY